MEKLKALLAAEADDYELQPLYRYCEVEPAGWYVNETVLSEEEQIEKLQGKDIFITSYDRVTRRDRKSVV